MEKGKRFLVGLLILILILAMGAGLFLSLGGLDSVKRLINRARALGKIDDGELRAAMAQVLETNPEAESFISHYDGVQKYDLTLDLTGELRAGEIPYFTQWDARWGYCQYGKGLLGWTGCGPTALSMVAMGLTGNGTLTPAYVANLAIREGYCIYGNGTSWLLFSEGATMLGLRAKELILWEPTMRAELQAGRPIICIMGPGHFTTTGHYIVLVSCNDEGFQVYDPYRPSNCGTWTYEELEDEIDNLWSYEPTVPFPAADPTDPSQLSG